MDCDSVMQILFLVSHQSIENTFINELATNGCLGPKHQNSFTIVTIVIDTQMFDCKMYTLVKQSRISYRRGGGGGTGNKPPSPQEV